MGHDNEDSADAIVMSNALRSAIRSHRRIFIDICLIAFGLGFVAALCILTIAMHGVGAAPLFVVINGDVPYGFAFAVYILSCAVLFHVSEFLVAARYRPHDTHPRAFMIYHSKAYTLANIAAVVEFVVESVWIPKEWKLWSLSSTTVGVCSVLVVVLYGVRVYAMCNCGENFSLEIEQVHREEHTLVQTGVYKYLRHPAYFGWFWRTVFAQLVLMNPICFIAFTVVTWKFFAERIPAEEELLRRDDFFGSKYDEYRKSTITGIPFIQ